MATDDRWVPGGEAAEGHLAAWLGCSTEDVLEVLGGGWRRYRSEPGDDEFGALDWYVAGHPVQLMLGVDGLVVVLAMPDGHWRGAFDLHFLPKKDSAVLLRHDEVASRAPAAISSLLARRRRTFRWCHSCRRLIPPEERNAPDRCMDCASWRDGLIY